MKFIVENEAFSRALALVKNCVKASTIPILGHIAVEARGSEVIVRATNLEREVEAIVPAEVEQDGGAALPGDVLVGLVKRLAKGGQCQIDWKDGRAKLVSGASKYDLRTLELTDFPIRKKLADELTTFSMAPEALRSILHTVSYAADIKHPKVYAQGVCLHVAGQRLVAVATDHHRLARRFVDLPKGAAGMPSVVIPVEGARAIVDLLGSAEGDVELAVSPALVEVRLPGVRLTTALLDTVFPNYEQIIPKSEDVAALVRPYVLAEAVERAMVVYLGASDPHKKQPSIRVATGDGNIALEAGSAGSESARESVEAETNGHAAKFNLTAAYLSEMLKVWPESAVVAVTQEAQGSPVRFTAEACPEQLHLVMPVSF